MSDNINSQPTIYGPTTLDLAVQGSLQNVQTPLDSQLKFAANVQYVQQYVNQHGGGSSNVPLNITNNAYPLSGILDLSSKPTLVQTTSDQKSAVNKAYLDLSIQGVQDAIQAEQTRAQTAETNLATSISAETTRATTEEQKLQTQINNISGNTQNITTNSEDNSTTVSGGEIAGIVGASLALLALGATAVVAAAGGATQAAAMATTGAAMLTSAATSTANNLGQMLGDIKTGSQAAEFLDSDGFSIDKDPGAQTIRDANQNAFEFEQPNEWLQDPYWNDEKLVSKQDFLDRMKSKYGESAYFPSSSEQPSMQFSNEITARDINGLNDRLVSTDQIRQKASALDRVPLSQQQFDKLVAESANQYIAEETLLSDGSWAVTDFKNLNTGQTVTLPEPTVYVPRIERPGIQLLGPPVLRTMQTQEVNTTIDPATVKRKVNPYQPQNTNFTKSYGLHDAVSTTSAIQLIDDYVFPYIEFAQECVDTCEQNIANLEQRRLDQIPAPLETVSMNNQQLIDLPLVPLNNTAAITSVWAENIANQAVQTPQSNIDMSNLYKIKNLVAGTDPNDAVTVQQLSGYVPTGLSLTQIQANNIEDLNMFNRKITGLAPGVAATDAVRMDQLPSVTAGNQIVNSSGFSKVIVENDQTVRTYCNSDEVLRCEQSSIVASQPIFQLSVPPADTSNAILTRSQLDPYYLASNTTFNSIPINGVRDMQGYTITNLPDAVQSLDAVNYAQVLSLISQNAPQQIAYSTGSSRVQCSNNGITMTLQDSSFAAWQFTSSGAGTNSLRNIAYTGNQLNQTLNGTNAAQVFKFQGKTGNTPIHLTSAQTYSQISGASDAPYIQLLNSGIITVSSSIQQPLIQNPINSASNYLINGADLYNYIQSGQFLTQASTLNNLQAPTEQVSFAGQLLKQLANPVDAQDSATRIFVENTIASSLSLYSTSSQIAAQYLTQQDAALTYQTSSQVQSSISTALTLYSTTAQMNSSISTAVQPYLLSSTASSTYLTQSSAASTYQPQSTPFTSIVNNSINSVEAQSSNGGLKLYAGLSGTKTNILDIFAPAGQSSGTCEIQAKNKLNIVANSGLTSIMAGVGVNNSTLTIKSAGDTLGQIQYDNLVIGGRSTAPQLQLSSGHDASNNGYSLINNANSVSVNTLQLSPEITPNLLTGNNLLMFANSAGVTIKNQFNKATGLAYSQSSPQSNEFITRAYADATYTGGTPSSITSSGNATVACSSSGIDMTVNLVSATQPLRLSKATNAATFQLDTVTSGFGYLNIGGNLNSVQLLSPFFAASGSFSSTLGVVGQLTCGNTLLMNGSNNIQFTTGTVLGLPSCGAFSSSNNAPALASDVFGYVTNSAATQQTWTITLSGSSTTGIQWANIPANLSTTYAQTQKVKGSATNLITSSTVGCVSTTLASSWAIFELQCASNVRITQVWAYSTTAVGTSSQQNIASLTYSQQASSTAGRTNLQLYKPATAQGGDAFILYYVVDSY